MPHVPTSAEDRLRERNAPCVPLGRSAAPPNQAGSLRATSTRKLLLGMLLVGLLSALATVASAHGRSVSYSSWEIDAAGAEVTVRLKLLELSRLGPAGLPPGSVPGAPAANELDLPGRSFPREILLIADGAPCAAPPTARRRPDEPGWVRYRWRVECPENPNDLVIQSTLLLDVAPAHMHFARVRFAETSQSPTERVLTEASPRWTLRRAGNTTAATVEIGTAFGDYVALGVEHILSGWDHLAFVFGLLLLATRLGEVARLITGFTLAHSLTLALAVQGLVQPRAAAVEAVIAFSVALVAAEKGWSLSGYARSVPLATLGALGFLAVASHTGVAAIPVVSVLGLLIFTACYFELVRSRSSSWLKICLTFAFGLVHGFGFAGILMEMTLPSDRLIPALLGFNLGVEIGQLGVVAILWPLLVAGRRFAPIPTQRFAAELSAAALCGLGLYWMVERAFAL